MTNTNPHPELYLTPEQALELLDESDHAYLAPHAARGVAKAFGIDSLVLQWTAANTGHPKGLYVPGVRPGTKVEGYDACDLAETIARHLDAKFSSPIVGRGSGLRYAVDFIRRHTTILGADVRLGHGQDHSTQTRPLGRNQSRR